MRLRAARALCWILAVMLPLSMSASDVTAVMVQSKGSLKLNGKGVAPRSVAAFAGDRLETSADSHATLTMNGSTILLAENSALTLGGEDLKLHSGAVLVTSSRQETRINGRTIVPGEKDAKFLVHEEDGLLRIAALEGGLTIHGAGERTTLLPGEMASSSAAAAPMNTSSAAASPAIIALIAALVTAGVVTAIVVTRDDATSANPF